MLTNRVTSIVKNQALATRPPEDQHVIMRNVALSNILFSANASLHSIIILFSFTFVNPEGGGGIFWLSFFSPTWNAALSLTNRGALED